MKKAGKRALLILLVLAILVGFLYSGNVIGVPKSCLESDIRATQKVPEDWLVQGDISDTMAAFLSYSRERSAYTFSVYVNRPGVSFGYFFRGGGALAAEITEFTVEGYSERAFLSMNQQGVTRLEIDDGNTVQVIELDSGKPFALVLPRNAGDISFYDRDGTIVEPQRNAL